jgi:molybdopterin-guanine dinucleotide biosynthesis protein A
MGFNKALVRVGGSTLVERTARLLEKLTGTVLVVSRDRSVAGGLPYPVVDSEIPGVGPLAALAAGLRYCATPWALALACDLPLFPAALGAYILALATGRQVAVPRGRAGPPGSEAGADAGNDRGDPDQWDAVVPHWNGFWEPLAAAYARSCLSAIEDALTRGEKRVTSFYPQVRIRPVEEAEIRRFVPPGVAFFNVNTRSDLKVLQNLADL